MKQAKRCAVCGHSVAVRRVGPFVLCGRCRREKAELVDALERYERSQEQRRNEVQTLAHTVGPGVLDGKLSALDYAVLQVNALAYREGISWSQEMSMRLKQRAATFTSSELIPSVAGLRQFLFGGFLRAAADGHLFVPLDRIVRRFGAPIESTYPDASQSFLRFATSYWTFRIMVDDIPQTDSGTLIAEILRSIEIDVASVFFPSPGPIRIPRFFRARRQRKILAQSGAAIDIDEFLRRS